MAIAKKCDRCGRLYEFDRNSIIKYRVDTSTSGLCKYVDLCPACYRILEYFMENADAQPYICFGDNGIEVYPFKDDMDKMIEKKHQAEKKEDSDEIIFESYLGFIKKEIKDGKIQTKGHE